MVLCYSNTHLPLLFINFFLRAEEIRCNAISHFLAFKKTYFFFEHCLLFVNLVERLDFCSALSDIEVSHK